MYDFKDVYTYSKELNILYVEDDEATLHASRDIFESFFSTVSVAVDGVEGLEKYISFKNDTSKFYDLVITDINMPRKNGLEMIKDIRDIHSEQVVIVISAYNDSERLIELIREGISNFITKPIMPKQLIQILYKSSQSIYNEKIKNDFLIGQSKLASMGEMIDTIAHQWLGPINLMKIQVEMLETDIGDGIIEKKDIEECSKKQTLQINHIIETLNEFRAFFRPSSELSEITIKEIINSTLILLKDNLLLGRVDIAVNIKDDSVIKVIPSEFKHVLINIINNSIDEFKIKNTQNPKITITAYEKDDNVILELIDNAGGIPENIIDKIFKVNFTTKSDYDGTGMGLYLVTLILEKINAQIDVQNVQNGVKFTIMLSK